MLDGGGLYKDDMWTQWGGQPICTVGETDADRYWVLGDAWLKDWGEHFHYMFYNGLFQQQPSSGIAAGVRPLVTLNSGVKTNSKNAPWTLVL